MAQAFNANSLEAAAFLRENGLVQTGPMTFTEFYTGNTDRANLDEMDRRAAELTSTMAGVQPALRTKIGRNATCPCGSGKKFKKCCIHRARQTVDTEPLAA